MIMTIDKWKDCKTKGKGGRWCREKEEKLLFFESFERKIVKNNEVIGTNIPYIPSWCNYHITLSINILCSIPILLTLIP